MHFQIFLPSVPSPAIQSARAYLTTRYEVKSGAPNVIVLGGDGTFLSACGALLSCGKAIDEIEWVYERMFGGFEFESDGEVRMDGVIGREGGSGEGGSGEGENGEDENGEGGSGEDENGEGGSGEDESGEDESGEDESKKNQNGKTVPNSALINSGTATKTESIKNRTCPAQTNEKEAPRTNSHKHCPSHQQNRTHKYRPNDQNVLSDSTDQPLTFYVFNYGHAGHLCLLARDDLKKEFGSFKFVMRRLSKVVGKGYFVNELVIGRGYPGRLNIFEVHVYDEGCGALRDADTVGSPGTTNRSAGTDLNSIYAHSHNTFKITVRCDSVLISTQTGSSAYNKSAKGPVALVQCHVINFINPEHGENALVVGVDRTVRVKVLSTNGMGVIDGVRWISGDEFVVRGGAMVRMAYCERGRIGDRWVIDRLYGGYEQR
ncbi:hypothetical protein VCUG_02370 [Vavraia culicis subsp. floridensis]|uniref:Uncharacterized protein n=1 Tax=Vavraia culicis (isolate floridensis) TaxID=948595 RepID=L2GSR1_VAVCU|nr:uncharacterized protein VCUG_02370 [Vavraia culicis subsp. floridensis]ELA46135.1 hypothetical protein VCUG_02370 [Vavraia culicis subsp. floridensis]